MRWSLGRALPAHVLAQLSAQEKDFFKEYDRVLMKYMKDVCDGLPLDITLDQRPPPAKDNNIRVRVITEPENDIGAPQPLTPSLLPPTERHSHRSSPIARARTAPEPPTPPTPGAHAAALPRRRTRGAGEVTIRDTQYNLVSGSEHFMPLEEAEKLIREGVLQHAVV